MARKSQAGLRRAARHTSLSVESATDQHLQQQQGQQGQQQQQQQQGQQQGQKEESSSLPQVCSFAPPSTLDVGTAWNSLVCNEGVNLMNWWAQGTGKDMYWPPNQARNATLENQVPGSLGYCKFLAGLGLYGIPEKPDEWAFWLDTVYGE